MVAKDPDYQFREKIAELVASYRGRLTSDQIVRILGEIAYETAVVE